MELVIGCITTNYAKFSTRARRKEYWLFVLFYIIIYLLAIGIDVGLDLYDPESGLGFVSGFYFLATIIPYLAVAIRRLHDTDRSGWWVLIPIIPLVGTIWFIVLMCLKGTVSENRFGPDSIPS